jgi:hypothetical protein
MWQALEQWMSGCGLGTVQRKLLEELREIQSLDVLLPTKDKTLRPWVVTTSPQELRFLLHRLKLPLPNRPKIVQNVWLKLTLKRANLLIWLHPDFQTAEDGIERFAPLLHPVSAF